MTMKLTIKNEDVPPANRKARVSTVDHAATANFDRDPELPTLTLVHAALGPGESTEVYVHSMRDVLVEEVADTNTGDVLVSNEETK